MSLASSFGLYVLAGLCEIGGGYLWLYGAISVAILILMGSSQLYSLLTLVASMRRTVECSSCCLSCGAGESTEFGWIAMTRSGPLFAWAA